MHSLFTAAISSTAIMALGVAASAAPQTVRDGIRINTNGFNPNGDNQQDGIAVADLNGDACIVWADQNGTTNFTQDIYFSRSSDDSATFSAPVRVDLGEAANLNDSQFAKIAVAENGNIVVVWEERRDAFALQSNNQDVFYSLSTDGGATWLASALPLNVGTSGSDISSDVDRIWLRSSGNTFHCTWEEDTISGAGGDEEVWYTRSTDAGVTWSTPIILSPATGAEDVDEPKVAADGDLVIVTWVDVNNDLIAVRSTDNGATFSAPAVIESDTTGNVDDPHLEVRGNTVLIAWNENDINTPAGEGVHAVVSNDGGVTWRPEVTLSLQFESVAGADCDNPQVLIVNDNDMYVVYDEDSVSIANGTGGGSGGNECYIAYTKDGGATWTSDVPIDAGEIANRPELLVANGVVVVCLELGGNGGNQLAFYTSEDGGATFSGPEIVQNSGPDTDTQNRIECEYMVASPATNTVTVGYMDRPTGANEVYATSLLLDGGVGMQYCDTNANSTGAPGELIGAGSRRVSDNAFILQASSLPLNSFGFFIVSQSQGFVANPGGSAGNLCLAGSVGRYVGSGQIQNAGTAGAFELALDLTQTPQPNGSVSVASGETWNFQTWFRDADMGAPTSNFTNGLTLTFD